MLTIQLIIKEITRFINKWGKSVFYDIYQENYFSWITTSYSRSDSTTFYA